VLAEAASNVRYGQSRDVIGAYDALLRDERFAREHRPELVLRIGGGLTAKRLQAWLDQSGAYAVHASDSGAPVDPQHSTSLVLEGDVVLTCRELSRHAPDRRSSDWLRRFRKAEALARSALAEAFLADDRLTEPRAAREVVAALPPRSTLFLSSSMPIRDADTFALESGGGAVRVLANRGANGIDGVTSTALGAAIALAQPTVLLTGDLAFLHDLSGLLTAARHRLSLVVVVVNNDGGGIFSFLPIASSTEHFEALFGMPHGVSLRCAAELFGAQHHLPRGARALREAVREAARGGGLHVVEVQAERAANVAEHQALFEKVSRALEGVP